MITTAEGGSRQRWHQSNDREHGTWFCCRFVGAEIVESRTCVVDDFGCLTAINESAASANTHFWWSYRQFLEESAAAHEAWADAVHAAKGGSAYDSSLVAPAPIQVDIREHDWASQRVGICPAPHADHAQLVIISVNGIEVCLTVAQLAALTAAARELTRPARATRH